MLLRSSSTPILNSWIPNSTGSSPEPENLPQLTRTRSVTLISAEDSPGRSVAARSLRDSDLNDSETLKKVKGRIKCCGTPRPVKLKEKEKKENEMQRLLSSSGLGASRVAAEEEGCLAVVEEEERVLQTSVAGGGGSVVGGGRGFIGGDGSGSGSNSHDSNSWRGPDGTDAYYRKMIEANPGNALLLSNYAKFLKEIKGDLAKAEEYCGRAILANPADGTALSLYADLIWQSHKDASRAETYFDQAVKTEPDDW